MRVPCVHCGLPARAPAASARAAPPPAFCCLGCRLAWSITGTEGEEGRARWVQARFLLAALFAVAVMTLSLILYSEELYQSGLASTPLGQLLRWATLALSAPVVLLLAPALVDPAAHGWRRLASLDLWILLAAGAAWFLSAWRVLAGSGRIYFESAAMVLVLVTLGRYLDARAKVRVGEAAARLRSLLPETARRLEDGAAREVPLSDLSAGEIVRVAAGERVPVDGRVASGTAHADLAAVTGEHQPVPRGSGDQVPAGARVEDGALDLEVEAGAGRRLLDRVAETLDAARAQRTPAMRTADRLAGWILPGVLLLASAVLLERGASGEWEQGVMRALAVLLVSCPCALGIATPLASWSAVGAALEHGVLVRDAGAFGILPRLRTFFFDKTGTLSTGERRLARVEGDATLVPVAAALAGATRHPAGRALAAGADGPVPEEVRTVPGRGLAGRLAGERWFLGSPGYLAACGVPLPADLEEAVRGADAEGLSLVALGGGSPVRHAVMVLEESWRPEAREVLQELRRRGMEVEVLSGDGPGASMAAEAVLGVPVRSGLLPQEKAAWVAEAARDRGPVFYAGDGINDGPALSRADVSAAPGEGSDVARAAADLVLLNPDLRALPRMLELGRLTLKRVRFNFFWALAYNPLFLFLAATGRLSPVWCALAMAASSLLVAGLSAAPYRLTEAGSAAGA